MHLSSIPKFLALLALSIFLIACDRGDETLASSADDTLKTSSNITEYQRLAAFFEEIFERNVSQQPEFQARLGRKTSDYGRWNDYSEDHAILRNQQAEQDLQRLHDEFDFAA